jgi:hypothetical protein
MAAASGGGVNNGIAGVSTSLGSPYVQLVSAKVATSNGQVDISAVKAAWRKASTIPNLSAVNCSFEIFLGDSETEQILNDLDAHGTQVVISAGVRQGSGINLDLNADLVAFKNRHRNLIIVTANTGDNLYSTANYGQIVDIAAPGEMNVLSFLGDETGYHAATGPSVSTAQVSGVLALIRSLQSDPLKAREALLLGAAKNQRNGLLGKVSYGVLDIFDSLQMLDLPTGLTLLGAENAITRATAVGSVAQVAEPFTLQAPVNFGDDGVTRVVLFAINWPPTGGTTPTITAEGKVVSNGQIFPLPVEDVRQVPDRPWLVQITVKLNFPNNISLPGDIAVTVNAGGASSNSVLIGLKQ